jgi:glycosyltransferase involved in cell wall biosynthesis
MSQRNNIPTISIITPSYNQGEYLEECIKSVVYQNYPKLEYLIMDGGSTDNSVSIIKRYAKKFPKVIKWRSKKDGGQINAINEGMKLASGEIVAYLNSDDGYLPGTLHAVAQGFLSDPKKVWLTGSYIRKTKTKPSFAGYIVKYISFWQHIPWSQLLLVLNFIPQPSTFWCKSVIKKIGLFNNTYKLAIDYAYWVKLARISKPIILNRPLAFFRVHNLSKSSLGYVEQMGEQWRIAKGSTNNPIILLAHWVHTHLLILPLYKLTV